jgi:hypothetical protein
MYFHVLIRPPGTQREPKGSLGLLRMPRSGAAGVAKCHLLRHGQEPNIGAVVSQAWGGGGLGVGPHGGRPLLRQ